MKALSVFWILVVASALLTLQPQQSKAEPERAYTASCPVPPAVGLPDMIAEVEAWIANEATPLPAAAEVTAGPDAGCVACHGNAGLLMGMVTTAETPPEDGCAAAPTRPEFLNVFVNPAFPESFHGKLGCTGCHGGNGATADFAQAHAGMKNAGTNCATCHSDIATRHETSLHHTLNGMAHALELRAGEQNMEALGPVWKSDCATCHTTCSDCHVTMPKSVGGGLLQGHEFLLRAPMEQSCAVCHGTRAGGEYLGHHEGVEPDIHFEAGMHCLDCHTNDLHGDGTLYQSRWDVAGRAQCTDCHAALPQETVMAHNAAHTDVSCQVCHSQPYQNCFDCHTGEEDGAYFRKAGSKDLLLRIGRNTVDGYPYGIVALRNNPVARQSFDHFGQGLLPMFDDVPTWKTAAPHNIRRITAQNASCANCHKDESLFLNPEDLDPNGSAANAGSVLTKD